MRRHADTSHQALGDAGGNLTGSSRPRALRAEALLCVIPPRMTHAATGLISFGRREVAGMPITESSARRLELKSGSTTLLLDKDTGKASLQRKFLFWKLRPAEAPLSDIADVTVEAALDRASGVEVCHTTLLLRGGAGWLFPAADKNDAQANAAAIRNFMAG